MVIVELFYTTMKLNLKEDKRALTLYIKHLAESAIFEVITINNIFSYFER